MVNRVAQWTRNVLVEVAKTYPAGSTIGKEAFSVLAATYVPERKDGQILSLSEKRLRLNNVLRINAPNPKLANSLNIVPFSIVSAKGEFQVVDSFTGLEYNSKRVDYKLTKSLQKTWTGQQRRLLASVPESKRLKAIAIYNRDAARLNAITAMLLGSFPTGVELIKSVEQKKNPKNKVQKSKG